MHDVELLMCSIPLAPELLPLLTALSDWSVPREDRIAHVAPLRALVTAELAGASRRWTPHYDRALQWLAGATDDDLLEPAPGYELDPLVPRWTKAQNSLETHTRLYDRLAAAERAGVRTLGEAFDHVPVRRDELVDWFALCPDLDALDRRLRVAALTYLRDTRAETVAADLEEELLDAVEQHQSRDTIHRLRMAWYHRGQSAGRACALGLAITEARAYAHDFTGVPDALLTALGNPFDPLA